MQPANRHLSNRRWSCHSPLRLPFLCLTVMRSSVRCSAEASSTPTTAQLVRCPQCFSGPAVAVCGSPHSTLSTSHSSLLLISSNALTPRRQRCTARATMRRHMRPPPYPASSPTSTFLACPPALLPPPLRSFPSWHMFPHAPAICVQTTRASRCDSSSPLTTAASTNSRCLPRQTTIYVSSKWNAAHNFVTLSSLLSSYLASRQTSPFPPRSRHLLHLRLPLPAAAPRCSMIWSGLRSRV